MNKRNYLIAFVLLLAVLVSYYLYNKPTRNLTNETADLSLPAPELYRQFAENEAHANQQYLDKVIQVKGVLQNVSRGNDGSLNLTLDAGNPMGGVTCEIPGSNIPEGLNLKTGREMTVKGQCTGFLMDVVLVKCVVVP
ncbi:OB-fold protein [Adhaeribacter terreus]|uniref:tRNA_anti-like n=1 Tax=Adhaeribacter terreus TaxID=529703 RepID=A0ABW0E937_9BACT